MTVHRARGCGRYLALRRATPRHHVDEQDVSDRRPLLILLAMVVAVVAGTLAVTARWSQQVTPRAAVTLSAPVTVTPSFRSGLSPARGALTTRAAPPSAPPSANRSARPSAEPSGQPSPKPSTKPSAKPTAVLLGPGSGEALASALTDYCRRKALVVDGDWTCKGKRIDMDEACVFLYDEDAWAGMLNDDDPRTWRCYRDVS